MGQVWYGDELWNGGRERDYDGNGRDAKDNNTLFLFGWVSF